MKSFSGDNIDKIIITDEVKSEFNESLSMG